MRLVLTALVLGGLVLPQPARPVPDFSGVWIREPGGFELHRDVRRIARGQGMDTLAADHGYRIEIEQTTESITLRFPGRTPLTRPAVPLRPGPHATVHNRGDFWTKFVSDARWDGSTLTVSTRSFAGWWKNSHPDTAHPREIFSSVFALSLSAHSDRLTVVTTMSDDKGEAEYRQVFRRSQ